MGNRVKRKSCRKSKSPAVCSEAWSRVSALLSGQRFCPVEVVLQVRCDHLTGIMAGVPGSSGIRDGRRIEIRHLHFYPLHYPLLPFCGDGLCSDGHLIILRAVSGKISHIDAHRTLPVPMIRYVTEVLFGIWFIISVGHVSCFD